MTAKPASGATSHEDNNTSDENVTRGDGSAPWPKFIELSENFYITGNSKKKRNVRIHVRLNGEGIYLRRETDQDDHVNEQLIKTEDIIGSQCGARQKKRTRGGLSACKRTSSAVNADDAGHEANGDAAEKGANGQRQDNSAYLYVYAYVKREKPMRRDRTVRILRFRSYEQFAENLRAAECWHEAILINKAGGQQCDMPPQQLLILLNPKSGSGKGREMFQRQVAPVLKEAEIQYDLQVTTHANYAREWMRKRKDLLQRYSGIVVAGGDGLFYEVLNGLMDRPDWRLVSRRLPIGILPCGSGNGLARSIAHLYNEPYDPKPIQSATLTCVSGRSTNMDIVRIELAKGDKHTHMYSFLAVGWGLIADVDIESERLRSIGAPRFTLWSILRLITMRTYKGKLSYLRWRKPEATPSGEKKFLTPVPATAKKERRASVKADEFHDPLPDGEVATESEDDFVDAVSLQSMNLRTPVDSWHSATSRRTAYYSIAGQSLRSRRSVNVHSKIEMANAEFEAQTQPPHSTIPPLNMPLTEEGWHTESGEYVLVQAAYTPHLAADCYFAPESRLNDGIIYLVIVRAGISRHPLMQFLLAMSDGTHLPAQPHNFIEVVPVQAFRIEPAAQEGIITVDGERVDYGAIQGEILPGVIRVMVPDAK